jgi:DNA-binding transcriptional LysR family regulator
MDRFDAMQAFVRVVETRSFTRAADTLHMSKTTVTQLVQQLEARLRVKLLNRTTRKVNVTADGLAYYERAVRLLAELDDAETSLSDASTVPRGRLRVDMPAPFARLVVVPALPEFHARYPDIQIDFGVSDRMVDIIGENVDCVVRGGTILDQSLIARRIGDLKLGAFAAPAYIARRGKPADPRDLDTGDHDVVGFLWARTRKTYPYVMHRGSERLEWQGHHAFTFDDGNAFQAAILAGLGVAWLPEYMAKAHVVRGELTPLFEDWRFDTMPMSVAYPPNRHVSAKLRVFIEWVASLMEPGASPEEAPPR